MGHFWREKNPLSKYLAATARCIYFILIHLLLIICNIYQKRDVTPLVLLLENFCSITRPREISSVRKGSVGKNDEHAKNYRRCDDDSLCEICEISV